MWHHWLQRPQQCNKTTTTWMMTTVITKTKASPMPTMTTITTKTTTATTTTSTTRRRQLSLATEPIAEPLRKPQGQLNYKRAYSTNSNACKNKMKTKWPHMDSRIKITHDIKMLSPHTRSCVSGGLCACDRADRTSDVTASAPHSRILLWGCWQTCKEKSHMSLSFFIHQFTCFQALGPQWGGPRTGWCKRNGARAEGNIHAHTRPSPAAESGSFAGIKNLKEFQRRKDLPPN